MAVDLIFNLTTYIKAGDGLINGASCYNIIKRFNVLANLTIISQLYYGFYFIIQILVGKGDMITGAYMYLEFKNNGHQYLL